MGKTIHLQIDHFPTSEEMMTDKQRGLLRKLACEMQESIAYGGDPERMFSWLRMKFFLRLAGLKLLKRMPVTENGETHYFSRRRGITHLFEEIPLSAMWIAQLVTENLGWLTPESLVSYSVK